MSLLAEPIPVLNHSLDSDLDAYINFDQQPQVFPSPSASSAHVNRTPSPDTGSTRHVSLPSTDEDSDLTAQSPDPSQISHLEHQQTQQQYFTVPSHEYGQFKQQTGLPPGGLANTLAFNQSNAAQSFNPAAPIPHGLAYPPSHGSLPSQYPMQQSIEPFYNSVMPHSLAPEQPVPLSSSGSDTFDLDVNSPGLRGGQYMARPEAPFVDPVSLNPMTGIEKGVHKQEMFPSPSSGIQPGRFYPGIHQQQAALAKSAVEQRRQAEMMRKHQQMQMQMQYFNQCQQQQQQHRQQQEQQRQLKEQQNHEREEKRKDEQQERQHSRQPQLQSPPDTATSKPTLDGSQLPPVDPAVNERIDKVLHEMRQACSSNTRSSIAAEASAAKSASLHISRAKKEQEDMDEDERLLASEAGKRLTSRERRQLRNKVSARAFRSRRKGIV